MRRIQNFVYGTLGMTGIAIVPAILVGWVANIFQIVALLTAGSGFTPLLIVKLVGVVAAPLGAVMGWAGFFI